MSGYETIMPCFDTAQDQGTIIGRLLAGYGELEFEMFRLILPVMKDDVDKATRAIFSKRGEEWRIGEVRRIASKAYHDKKLIGPFREALADMEWCRKTRNQYAHCNWYYTLSEGLWFVNLEEMTKTAKPIKQITAWRYPIDTAVLRQQEGYFCYVRRCFWHLESEYRLRAGLAAIPHYTKPPKAVRPPRHS